MRSRLGVQRFLMLAGLAVIWLAILSWGTWKPRAPPSAATPCKINNELLFSRKQLTSALCGDEPTIDEILHVLKKDPSTFRVVTQSPWKKKQDLHCIEKPLLAQSIASATMALALTNGGVLPGQLAGVPYEFLKSTLGFDADQLKIIPYASDLLTSEQLYLLQPLCIVSSFSHPPTIERYKRMGLDVEMLPSPNSFEAIWNSLDRLGKLSGTRNKSNKLIHLCESVLHLLQLRLQNLKNENYPLVVLEFYHHLSIPTGKNLHIRWLMNNMTIDQTPSESWSTPIDYETLHVMNPKYVLVLCENPVETERFLQASPSWQRFTHSSQCKYSFVSTNYLHSPTQFLTLGLYDMTLAIGQLYSSKENAE